MSSARLAIDELRSRLGGGSMSPGGTYTDTCTLFNTMVDRRTAGRHPLSGQT